MNTRYLAVDALRGLIMILMAIDHASAFVSRQHSSEFWAGAMTAYTSTLPFLTRLVTHLCAPGFFFLMGAGIYWFAASRRESGWNEGAVVRRTALRGLAILLAGQIFETAILFSQGFLKPAAVNWSQTTAPPPIDGSELYWGLITLSGLGLVMIVCAGLLRLPEWSWLVVTAVSVVLTNSFLPASGKPGPLWETILLAPGLSQHVIVIYPVIPWLAVAAAGMSFAYWWRGHPSQVARGTWVTGAVLLGLSLILRVASGWGNIRLPRDSSWIEFLNNVKYPPSLVFWTMFVGIDLLLLGVLMRLPGLWKSERSPLIVFGQAPLFFYLVHFYAFGICGFVFFREAGSLGQLYLCWALVVAALYPLCAWYRKFKLTKPRESLWRLF